MNINSSILMMSVLNYLCTAQTSWALLFTNPTLWASLVAQRLRIHLPMQVTRVWALVREDPTCCRATGPLSHNYWACALEPASHNYWAHMPQLLKPACLQPVLHNKRSHRNEKPVDTTRESPHAATKTQCSQKKKKKIQHYYESYKLFLNKW